MQILTRMFHHRQPDNESTTETQGFLLNWGWTYDLMTHFLFKQSFGESEQAFRYETIEPAQLKPGESVLEVGCGTGTWTLIARKRVGKTGRVAGIDPAPKQILRALHKAAKQGLSIDFQIGVIERLAFPDHSFDVVLSSFMMHHLPDDLKQRGLAEIARVLKPGGRLLIIDAESPSGPWKSSIHDLPAIMKEAGFLHLEEATTRFKDVGFVLGKTDQG